jgi:hypothetical protein
MELLKGAEEDEADERDLRRGLEDPRRAGHLARIQHVIDENAEKKHVYGVQREEEEGPAAPMSGVTN